MLGKIPSNQSLAAFGTQRSFEIVRVTRQSNSRVLPEFLEITSIAQGPTGAAEFVEGKLSIAIAVKSIFPAWHNVFFPLCFYCFQCTIRIHWLTPLPRPAVLFGIRNTIRSSSDSCLLLAGA